jgi:hypothetical protein
VALRVRIRWLALRLAFLAGFLPLFAGAAASSSFAVVALVDDANLRAEIEDGVASKLDDEELDLVASHAVAEDVRDVAGKDFLAALRARGIGGLLVLRPAPVGADTSLATVRAEITPQILRDFRGFAKRVSSIDASEAPRVMHIAVYVLADGEPRLATAGATWLDGEPASRQDAVERLDGLVALNIQRAGAQIRDALQAGPRRR